MTAYKHGVSVQEAPTAIIPPRRVETGLPVVVGTAPGVLDDNNTLTVPVNEPTLIYGYDEFVKIFGSDNTGAYTLPGFAEVFFNLYNVEPAVFINVYDPAVHTNGVADVTSTDIIGGVTSDDKKTGLELVGEVFPRFRLVPGQILAPGFSQIPSVGVVMGAKAGNINGIFSAVAVLDIPVTGTDAPSGYSGVPDWISDNNYKSSRIIACWPQVVSGGKTQWLSSHAAGVICRTDAKNGDAPYKSPSNERLEITGTAPIAGENIWLSPDQAAYLNGQGVVTALNFVCGWRLWGNRTGVYPDQTDVKETLIPIRRMFNWIGNTLTLTWWQKIDAPINRRLIETVVDSANIWLNGLAAREIIRGGRVEFRRDENPSPDVMDGIVRFHVYVTPPSPAREIDFVLEYDPAYIETLFAGVSAEGE